MQINLLLLLNDVTDRYMLSDYIFIRMKKNYTTRRWMYHQNCNPTWSYCIIYGRSSCITAFYHYVVRFPLICQILSWLDSLQCLRFPTMILEFSGNRIVMRQKKIYIMQGFANMGKSGNWNSPVSYIDSTLYIHAIQIFIR